MRDEATGERKVLVEGGWPDLACVSLSLLNEARPPFMLLERGNVRFRMANGEALYKHVGEADFGRAVVLRKITSSLEA